jgi:hypothetical protein
MYIMRDFMVSAQEYFTSRNWVAGGRWEVRAIKEEERFIGAKFAAMAQRASLRRPTGSQERKRKKKSAYFVRSRRGFRDAKKRK